MCMVSATLDWARQHTDLTWPYPNINPNPIQPIEWNQDSFKLFKEILEKIKELDTKLGQPDCEDPAKAAWMREIETRLKNLEENK